VGVAGTGFAAGSHVDGLRRVPGIEVVAVSSASVDRARRFADVHGIPSALGDHRELAEHEGIDVLHTCTTNISHATLNALALSSGKHVLTEKPMAVTTEEGEGLLRATTAAADQGCVAGVCFQYRHYPLVQQLREMLARGEHGEVHFVHGGYLQDWLLHETDWNWRVDPALAGPSRAAADIGSHWVDLIQHVTGKPVVAVLADLGTTHEVRERGNGFGSQGPGVDPHRVSVKNEDFGTVLIRFAGGTRGTFTVSQTSAGHKNKLFFEINAAAASLAWDQESPDRAWVGRRGQPNLEYVREAEQLHGAAADLVSLPPGHPEGWSDALRNLFADFYAAVSASVRGEPYEASFATFAEGQRVGEVAAAIVESNRSQSWTPVGGHRAEVAKS